MMYLMDFLQCHDAKELRPLYVAFSGHKMRLRNLKTIFIFLIEYIIMCCGNSKEPSNKKVLHMFKLNGKKKYNFTLTHTLLILSYAFSTNDKWVKHIFRSVWFCDFYHYVMATNVTDKAKTG